MLIALKSALAGRTISEKARKYRHRDSNNAPAYSAGQGDVMPDPASPSVDLPDLTAPGTSEAQ